MKQTKHDKEISEYMKRLQGTCQTQDCNINNRDTEKKTHNFPPQLDIADDCTCKPQVNYIVL